VDLQRHRHAESLPAKVPPWTGANASNSGRGRAVSADGGDSPAAVAPA
jgi:hypothetical protein